MELELNRERFSCYRALPQLLDTHEETAETIVPDYLPDIARTIESSGCLFLRSHEISDGRVTVSGVLRMTLLYLPEDGQSLKAFAYTLPLECTVEGRIGADIADCSLEGRLCSCDARAINPRKIFTRASVALSLTPYTSCTLSVCSGIEEQERYGIETLCEKREITMIRALREREFTFSDEVLLSGTKEPVRELLRTKCALRLTDQRQVGNKIVLKGIASLESIYLDTDGKLLQSYSELPFSQLLDGIDGETGETSVRTALRLSGAEVRIGSESEPDNDRLISLRLSISAFAVLSEKRSICCVTDLYSTSCSLDANMEELVLSGENSLFTREQLARESIETGTEIRSILSSDVTFLSAALSGSGEQSELRATAELRLLYLDENGTPLHSERRVDILMKTELPPLARLQSVSAGALSASISAGGAELRFPVIFTLSQEETAHCPCLTSLQAEARAETEENLPSLVLRAQKQGERLWDIAKQYRTTVSAILAANDLSAEADAAAGTLLLIPRRR